MKEPNWQNRAIQRRAETIIKFCEDYLVKKPVFWLSRSQIHLHFGNTSRHPGAWFRSQLLIQEDGYYNPLTGQCKKYRLSMKNLEELKKKTGYITDYAVEEHIQQELESGEFVYQEKSQRRFHPLQFKPKYKKRTILSRSGYKYEFDIECAAHTLILQHAQHLGHDKSTPRLDEYLMDRRRIRAWLAEELGCEIKTAKTILVGLLQGAVISSWHTSTIFEQLAWNRSKLEHLRNQTWIQEYQQEVREIWRTIKTQRGITERLTGRIKSGIYRELEQQVGKEIQRYLKKSKNTYFFEHDGWSCREMIDPRELTARVRCKTGFVITLDCTIWEDIDSTNNNVII